MNRVLFLLLLAAPAGCGREAPVSAPRPALGMNLAGPVDWGTELPFVDVFRLSHRWVSQRPGAAWGQGPALDLDEHGWVRRLEPGSYAEIPLCNIPGGHYPGGEYTLLYEGDGRLEAVHAAEVISREPGRLRLRVNPAKGPFFLRLLETNPQNYLRRIRVFMPGFTDGSDPWNPAFLRRWQGMACFRFMDWMETNGSPVASWEDRPRLEDAGFAGQGIAPEHLIDLCNRQQADAWFCMPHLADDGYVRSFAELVKARLAPPLRVYLEYSNEVWNGQFPQSRYAAEQGIKAGLGPPQRPWEAGWHFTARRSLEIFRIWEEVLGGRERLVRVLPSQAANAEVSRQVCDFEQAAEQADALAIAPYLTLVLSSKSKPTASEAAAWSVEQVLDHVEGVCLPQSIRWMRESQAVARQRGLSLVAYEAGQHLVGVLGAENDERLTWLLQAANAHPRMGEIYRRYYEAWVQEGGDLLCHFSSVCPWSKWGSWGLLQHAGEEAAAPPKFTATLRWAKSLGQNVRAP